MPLPILAPGSGGYSDLVVLINPAIEAMRHMPIYRVARYQEMETKVRKEPRIDYEGEIKPVR